MIALPVAGLLLVVGIITLVKGVRLRSWSHLAVGGSLLLLPALVIAAIMAYTKLPAFEATRLRAGLAHSDSARRQIAIGKLSVDAPEAPCLPLLAKALDDDDRNVRIAVLHYLRRRYGDPVAIPPGIRINGTSGWSSEYATGEPDPMELWLAAWKAWITARTAHPSADPISP